MNITEKAAYLKGLAEGLGVEETSKEGKLLLAIVDVLEDMALTVADIDDEMTELVERVDEIDEDLGAVEDEFYDECDCDEDEDEFYEIECPECGESVYIDEDLLDTGKTVCPNCGKEIEFEVQCDCGDDCCDHH